MLWRLTRDRVSRETLRAKRVFASGRKAESAYARALRGVARAVGDIVDAYRGVGLEGETEEMLRRYAAMLRPWARTQAERMLADVSRRDERAWKQLGQEMGRALHEEIENAPTGAALRAALEEQVTLITSLPLDAARRVHEIATGALYAGSDRSELRNHILATGHVTKSRAELIARTEVSRVSTELTRVRSEHVGSEGYIWRTAEDALVRPRHRKLAGQFFRWDEPPIAGENGERAHAGQIYNCRCWAEPVFPDEAAAPHRRAA